MNGHSRNDEIGTPDDLFQWLERRFIFSYDAFASHTNALLPLYSTQEGTFEIPGGYPAASAIHLPVSDEDGLTFPWEGRRVFWNPPYSRPLFGQAIEKAIEERNAAEISVGLVKVDTSTKNWALLEKYAHVEWLPRVKYKGQKQAATFHSAIAIMRPDKYTPRRSHA